MLAAAGLTLMRHDILPLSWTFDDPAGLFDVFLIGTVGARMLILALPEDVRARVAATVSQLVEEGYRTDKGSEVPVPVAKIVAVPT